MKCLLQHNLIISKMESVELLEIQFLVLGNEYTKSTKSSSVIKLRRFINHFGVNPKLIATIWSLIRELKMLRTGCKRKYILMTFCFIKCNISENKAHSMFDVDEKTFREWKYHLMEVMSRMKVVSIINLIFLQLTT